MECRIRLPSTIILEFSRRDRNITPQDGEINGVINDKINELDADVLSWLRDDPYLTVSELAEKSGKSQRTITRALMSLKAKHLIERNGSNKTGYWKVI